MSSQGAAGSRRAAPEVPGPHVPVLHCVASPLTPNARSLQEETWTLHAASQTASPPRDQSPPCPSLPGVVRRLPRQLALGRRGLRGLAQDTPR